MIHILTTRKIVAAKKNREFLADLDNIFDWEKFTDIAAIADGPITYIIFLVKLRKDASCASAFSGLSF